MKNIDRRIRRLEEERFGTAADNEFARRLLKRVEEGRQRLAEAKARGEWSGSVGDDKKEDLRGLSFTEILHLGRGRLVRAKAEREKASGTSPRRAMCDELVLRRLLSEPMPIRLLGFPRHHNNKEDVAFVPTAEPGHSPIINMIAK